MGFLTIAVICAFYYWTAFPEKSGDLFPKTDDGYYNLVTRGFLKGQLAMDLPADPELAQLDNPWDPNERGALGKLDVSYYRSRYFLYFGVSPVVLLFLPVRLLTGHFVTETLACVIFASIGFVTSAWLLLSVGRRYFSRVRAPVLIACLLAMGQGSVAGFPAQT